LGWKYIETFDKAQQYKEGKFVIEKGKIIKLNAMDMGLEDSQAQKTEERGEIPWPRNIMGLVGQDMASMLERQGSGVEQQELGPMASAVV